MKKNYKTPVVEVIKMATASFLAGSSTGLMTPVSFDDGYDTDTPVDL